MMRSYNLRSDADIIKLDHVPFLGHEVGQCQVNPKSSQGFVHIPKNASTEMKQLLGDWEFANYKKKSLDEYLVILRDPRDRWISGMTELLVGKNSRIGRENRKWMSSLSDAKKLVDQTLLQQLIRLLGEECRGAAEPGSARAKRQRTEEPPPLPVPPPQPQTRRRLPKSSSDSMTMRMRKCVVGKKPMRVEVGPER